jgi:hypothetical protein
MIELKERNEAVGLPKDDSEEVNIIRKIRKGLDRDKWQGKNKPETEPMLRIEDITPAWIHDHMKELSLKHVEFVTKEVENP